MTVASASLCLLVSLMTSCGKARVSPAETSLEADVHQYLRLAVALGERDPDSLDYYYGSEGLVAGIRKQPPTLREIKQSADSLVERLKLHAGSQAEDRMREEYLIRQLRAISSRVDTLTSVPMTFDQETAAVFGVTVPASYDRLHMAQVREKLDRLLPGKGSLAQRYEAFDTGFTVPSAKLKEVMQKAIQGCREATMAHVDLPAGEATELKFVHNKPWSGYSFYQGNYRSVVEINTDYALTVDQVLQLACHETYPGHHVYNSLQEAKLVRGRKMDELAVQPTFSPQSLVSEAAATLAIDVAFPPVDRLRFEREVLFPLAGLDGSKAARYRMVEALVDELHQAEPEIARDYLDGKLEFERANSALEEQTLMTHGEVALKYINEYRSYIATYTYGRDLTAKLLGQPIGAGGQSSVSWERYSKWMMSPPATMNSEAATPAREDSTSQRRVTIGRNEGAVKKQLIPVI